MPPRLRGGWRRPGSRHRPRTSSRPRNDSPGTVKAYRTPAVRSASATRRPTVRGPLGVGATSSSGAGSCASSIASAWHILRRTVLQLGVGRPRDLVRHPNASGYATVDSTRPSTMMTITAIMTTLANRDPGSTSRPSGSSGTAAGPARRAHAAASSPAGARPCSCPIRARRRPGSATSPSGARPG